MLNMSHNSSRAVVLLWSQNQCTWSEDLLSNLTCVFQKRVNSRQTSAWRVTSGKQGRTRRRCQLFSQHAAERQRYVFDRLCICFVSDLTSSSSVLRFLLILFVWPRCCGFGPQAICWNFRLVSLTCSVKRIWESGKPCKGMPQKRWWKRLKAAMHAYYACFNPCYKGKSQRKRQANGEKPDHDSNLIPISWKHTSKDSADLQVHWYWELPAEMDQYTSRKHVTTAAYLKKNVLALAYLHHENSIFEWTSCQQYI